MREDLLLGDETRSSEAYEAIIAANVARWRRSYRELCRLESSVGDPALQRSGDRSALDELHARLRASARDCDRRLAEICRAVSAKRAQPRWR